MIKQLIVPVVLSLSALSVHATDSAEYEAFKLRPASSATVTFPYLKDVVTRLEPAEQSPLPDSLQAVLVALSEEHIVGKNATFQFSFKKGFGFVFKQTF